MAKRLRVISIGFPFQNQQVVQEQTLANERALFDFDVAVIRPSLFGSERTLGGYEAYEKMFLKKKSELNSLLAQGGVLVVVLDVPDIYNITTGGYSSGNTYSTNNYAFLQYDFAYCLRSGSGQQITYTDQAEPFVTVLKKSTVAWTAYVNKTPVHPFSALRFFASAGSGALVGAKMPYSEGHLILLPNLKHMNEDSFFEACAEYRYKRQGTTPPDWVNQVLLPGMGPMEEEISELQKQLSALQKAKEKKKQTLEELSAYKKLLYEKGKTQLEPVVRRALNHLEFAATPGELIEGTNYEVDGKTEEGSIQGIVEVKGSKKQIVLDEFSPFVVKILADFQTTGVMRKGILVGNGLCETKPESRLDSSIFSPHVLDAAKRNSVALINTTELYWLCCALLSGEGIEKEAVRETVLRTNGYVDLKPFCRNLPFPAARERGSSSSAS